MSYRILFVVESLFPLGAAQQLKLLVDGLVGDGHQIHLAVLGQRSFEPTAWVETGAKIVFLNGDDRTPLHTYRDGFFVVKELRKLISLVNPEIVHAWCGRSELLTLLATERLPFGKRMKPLRLVSTELFLQPEKRFTRRVLERRMLPRVERTLVPHSAVQVHLVENGYDESRISIIPNACPVVEVDRAATRAAIKSQLDLPDSVYLAGAAAPLRHRSRLKDLIWATDLLNTIRNDVHLLIIGAGWQLRRLKRFAALTESKSQIHFLGRPETAFDVLAALDFYWHSHLRDPLSGNLLAAMSAGVPSISVYGPGTEEVIRHQQTGFAVNFGARDEFARWTKFLIERPGDGQRLAAQGREFVRDSFPQRAMIDGYLAIYNGSS